MANEITPMWYPLSGVPQYGMTAGGDVYRRSYVLYGGRRPRSEYGPWQLVGHVAPEELDSVIGQSETDTESRRNTYVRLRIDGAMCHAPFGREEALSWLEEVWPKLV